MFAPVQRRAALIEKIIKSAPESNCYSINHLDRRVAALGQVRMADPEPENPATLQYHQASMEHGKSGCGDAGSADHDLRHSFCSSAVAAGVDLYTVGKIAGHKDYKSTQRYSHLANNTLMKAVEKSAANVNVDWANAGGAGHGV